MKPWKTTAIELKNKHSFMFDLRSSIKTEFHKPRACFIFFSQWVDAKLSCLELGEIVRTVLWSAFTEECVKHWLNWLSYTDGDWNNFNWYRELNMQCKRPPSKGFHKIKGLTREGIKLLSSIEGPLICWNGNHANILQ